MIPIVLLHGLGAHPITFKPLEYYLNCKGFNTHNIYYPVDEHHTIQESCEYVDGQINHLKQEKIIIIGQSMGGVIANNMYRLGYDIALGIYIGSPLHGAYLLNQLDELLPTFIKDRIHKPPYDILMNKQDENEPDHDYRTISMGWFNSDFDGCVYKNETIMDPSKHTHLSWADHRTIFANPRLWFLICDQIQSSNEF